MSRPKFGWVPPEKRSYGVEKEHDRVLQDMPLFTAAGRPIAGTGEGKVVLLHKLFNQLGVDYPIYRQTIGDCVSHGWAKAIMARMVAEIVVEGQQEQWPGVDIASEWIYGTSRVLVGKQRLGNGDGSIGSWAAKAVQEHGNLIRKLYGGHDLSHYSGQRAKEWGFRGLPYDLEEIADENPVEKVALVTSYEQGRDAVANGYAIAACSTQGFTSQRDREGFAKASGRWAHCMAFVAVDDAHRRPGLLCCNSWGPNWISGPKRHDQPDGSFWVDADTVDRMLRGEDSYAVAGFKGFVKQNLWSLW